MEEVKWQTPSCCCNIVNGHTMLNLISQLISCATSQLVDVMWFSVKVKIHPNVVLITVYSENLVMLNFFFFRSVSIRLLTAHRQHPKMDCCPFWASVALAIPTTKQPKIHVAVVKQTKNMSKYITHIRGHVLKFYWDISKPKYIENYSSTFILQTLMHHHSCMNLISWFYDSDRAKTFGKQNRCPGNGL